MLEPGTHTPLLFPLIALLVGAVLGTWVCIQVQCTATGKLFGSVRLPRIVSALTCGASWAALAHTYGPTLQTLELCLFTAILLQISLIDLDRCIIPNASVVIAAVIRLVYLGLAYTQGLVDGGTIARSLASALIVAALLLVTILIADRILGTDSMGGGDLKLLVVAGLYFSWVQCLFLVMVACILGLISSVALTERGEDNPCSNSNHAEAFPFGPPIALACVITMLCGTQLESCWIAFL